MIYFNSSASCDTTVFNIKKQDITLKKGDLLYLMVQSPNEQINSLFVPINQSNNNYNRSSLYLKGYSINNNGELNLPLVGHVKIEGLTVDSAEQVVTKAISQYFNDMTVNVKFLSYKITLLGEIKHPGAFYTYDRNLSFLEALGQGGDLTDFGDRKRIKLIHQSDTGISSTTIDLTNDDVFTQEKYYVQPNDIIYVPPVRNKNFRLNAPLISIIFSSISTLILVLNFVK
jgi:polysaccharide export outer membrane protein